MIEIKPLREVPEYLDDVVELCYSEFLAYMKVNKLTLNFFYSLEAVEKLRKIAEEDEGEIGVPQTLLALENGQLVGIGTLLYKSYEENAPHYPSVAYLAVAPTHRKQGIGAQLLSALASSAKARGYHKIFLQTDKAGDYYKRRNWEFVENVVNEFGECQVYRYEV